MLKIVVVMSVMLAVGSMCLVGCCWERNHRRECAASVLLLLFAESISVIQRGSVNDSRAVAFRHGAVVARKGSLVMNQYVQPPVQTIRSPVQL